MFIIGIPSETIEEVEESIEFAYKYKFCFGVFSYMTFYPGSNFWLKYRNDPGLSDDFSEYELSNKISYIDKNRSKDEIEKLMKKAFLKFYTQPRVVFSLMLLMLKNPSKLFVLIIAFLKILAGLLKKQKKMPYSHNHLKKQS